MVHNAELAQIRVVENHCSNFKFDIFGGTTNYLDMFKTRVSDDYDLIVLDSTREYSDCEPERMKTMALDISKDKNKRVTIAYRSYTNDYPACGYLQQTLLYSVKDGKSEEEVIPMSYSEQKFFCALDLLVLALEKHREYNNQKQFKK